MAVAIGGRRRARALREALDSCVSSGLIVAHDVPRPCSGSIAHVAVGPGGLFVLEADRGRSGEVSRLAEQRQWLRAVLGQGRLPEVPIAALLVVERLGRPVERPVEAVEFASLRPRVFAEGIEPVDPRVRTVLGAAVRALADGTYARRFQLAG
jgi:hypothetical protein